MAFVPAAFSAPVINPVTANLFRRTPYISVSEYNFAPTAVGTTNLVPGGTQTDSLASLAQVISRASSWIDQYCFHRADGTLAASATTEATWAKIKPGGSIALICNYKPVLQVSGLALGPVPSQLANVDSGTAADLWIRGKVIWVPGTWSVSQTTSFPRFASAGDGVYAVWTYVNGFPHTSLAQTALANAVSITVAPSVPGGSAISGVYPGTQLTIHDGTDTEVVVVQSVTGLTLGLASGLQFAHTVPATPDTIRVTAIPWAVEQACISLTSCLIKTRGTRAAVLPSTPGTPPPKQALAQAGALEDYEVAVDLLEPYRVVYLHD